VRILQGYNQARNAGADPANKSMNKTNKKSGRILSILAHPDDESFGMGGTLAYYSQMGCEVTLVTATLGEAGKVAPMFLKEGQSVADLRREELNCACKALGIQELILLGHRDSGMAGWAANQHPQALINQPLEQLSGQIAALIRQIEPDVVLTFDPIGGYRHPDHIHIHNTVVRAFQQIKAQQAQPLQQAPFRLFYHLMPKHFLKAGIWTLRLQGKNPRKFGDSGDIDLVDIANQNFPVNAKINYASVAQKQVDASLCHASQGGDSRGSGIQGWMIKVFSRPIDTYMLGWPEPKLNQTVLKDLFEDLN